eukprot:TRINITY_DN3929_c0_g1_i2.p1 TRINITY_DN3929_c0_g1~~TRINITY_DN3929_c0_g1_i2.p1  ORF type:complete len:319 (-),score=74.27 TRINITY_DN3929_c0_g1_i2:469-1425(-)
MHGGPPLSDTDEDEEAEWEACVGDDDGPAYSFQAPQAAPAAVDRAREHLCGVVVEPAREPLNNAQLRRIVEERDFQPRRTTIDYEHGERRDRAAVWFHTEEEADRCVAMLNGTQLQGELITVRKTSPAEFCSLFRSKSKSKKHQKHPKTLEEDCELESGGTDSVTELCALLKQTADAGRQPFIGIDFECAASVKGALFPCEIGACAFTLDNIGSGFVGGIEGSTFHAFIDPGPLPSEALQPANHCTNHIHGIPFRNFERARGDYTRLWFEFVTFVREALGDAPLILVGKGIATEKAALAWLANAAGLFSIICFLCTFS